MYYTYIYEMINFRDSVGGTSYYDTIINWLEVLEKLKSVKMENNN